VQQHGCYIHFLECNNRVIAKFFWIAITTLLLKECNNMVVAIQNFLVFLECDNRVIAKECIENKNETLTQLCSI